TSLTNPSPLHKSRARTSCLPSFLAIDERAPLQMTLATKKVGPCSGSEEPLARHVAIPRVWEQGDDGSVHGTGPRDADRCRDGRPRRAAHEEPLLPDQAPCRREALFVGDVLHVVDDGAVEDIRWLARTDALDGVARVGADLSRLDPMTEPGAHRIREDDAGRRRRLLQRATDAGDRSTG